MDQRHLLQSVIRQLVDENREVEMPVYGLSMFPFLTPGSVVRVKRVLLADVRLGDIVLFEGEQKLVLHRVVKKNTSYIQPKGDSLISLDRRIVNGDFIGLVTHYKRHQSHHRFISSRTYSFSMYAKLMVIGRLFWGYFLHPLSFLWYKFFGKNIDN